MCDRDAARLRLRTTARAVCAPAPPLSPPHSPIHAAQIASMHALIESLASRAPLKNARIGVSIVQAATGRVVEARDADGEFAPASNFKLLDAAAALAYLNPRNRFVTQLLRARRARTRVCSTAISCSSAAAIRCSRANDLREARRRPSPRMGFKRSPARCSSTHRSSTASATAADGRGMISRTIINRPSRRSRSKKWTADIAVTPGAGRQVSRLPRRSKRNGGAMTVVSRAITTARERHQRRGLLPLAGIDADRDHRPRSRRH